MQCGSNARMFVFLTSTMFLITNLRMALSLGTACDRNEALFATQNLRDPKNNILCPCPRARCQLYLGAVSAAHILDMPSAVLVAPVVPALRGHLERRLKTSVNV